MNRAALALILAALTAGPALAQGRGKHRHGVPPGHLPPAGLCRVWYDGVPPGRQPPPTSCYEAERVASRDRRAHVVYGGGSHRDDRPVYRDDGRYPDRRYPDDIRRGDDGRRPNGDGRRPNRNGDRTGRAVPRGEQYPNSYPYPDARSPQRRGDYGYASEAFRRGHDDGVVKGREDARDRDSFDPARHRWYRSADRGYNSRYGSREEYRAEYRRGFLSGYESAHDGRRRSGGIDWWPF